MHLSFLMHIKVWISVSSALIFLNCSHQKVFYKQNDFQLRMYKCVVMNWKLSYGHNEITCNKGSRKIMRCETQKRAPILVYFLYQNVVYFGIRMIMTLKSSWTAACVPGTTWKQDCNICFCSSTGESMCTLKGCFTRPAREASCKLLMMNCCQQG